jgi:hypothetical protein
MIAFAAAIAMTLAAEVEPPACVLLAKDSDSATAAFAALDSAKLAPLCVDAVPAGGEFRIRRTITYVGDHRWVMDIESRRSRVHVRVDDTLFQPSESTAFVSRLAPARLLTLLDAEGWSDLWRADDPDCAVATSVTMEIGTVWEFVDASGYRARLGPKAQFCGTPYKTIIHDVSEFLDEVLLLTKLR